MSGTEVVTESGVAPTAGLRIVRAMAETLRVLEQAQKHVENGTIDNVICWHIGRTVMLAEQVVMLTDQVGRNPRL